MKRIGIVGGMGPEAGVDVVRALYSLDSGTDEQQRMSVILHSNPSAIADRTSFLLGESLLNPAEGIAAAISDLASLGTKVVGIACHAAHADQIYSAVQKATQHINVELVSMVESVVEALVAVGVTTRVAAIGVWGTYVAKVYDSPLERAGIVGFRLSPALAQRVHDIVWHREYGLKFKGSSGTQTTRNEFLKVCTELADQGVRNVVLACTELPSLLAHLDKKQLPSSQRFFDTNLILAKSLRSAAKENERSAEIASA